MRHLHLVAVAGLCATTACHDSVPGPAGPDTPLAAHFDSLAIQAKTAGQANREAAIDLALRALADGGSPSSVMLSTGSAATDTATFGAISWSTANAIAVTGGDSVTDSLMVLVAWQGLTADRLVVVRVGHPGLEAAVRSELATLGLTAGLPGADSLQSGAVVAGNVVTMADSGSIATAYDVLGTACVFVTVTSVTNDSGLSGTCDRELFAWQFALRFSPSLVPSALWQLSATTSPGVVIIH